MLILQENSKEKKAIDEKKVDEIKRMLEDYKKELKSMSLNVFSERQNKLAEVAGGAEELSTILIYICRDNSGKFSKEIKEAAAFYLGASVSPSYEVSEKGMIVLSQEFKDQLKNMVGGNKELFVKAMEGATIAHGYPEESIPLSIIIRLSNNPNTSGLDPAKNKYPTDYYYVPGVTSSTGFGFALPEFYNQHPITNFNQVIPITFNLPAGFDVSYFSPGAYHLYNSIYKHLEPYAGKALSADEYNKLIETLSPLVDQWLNSEYTDTEGKTKKVRDQISADLIKGKTIEEFIALMKMGKFKNALALLDGGTPTAVSFGDPKNYKDSVGLISSQKISEFLDHAFRYGAVVIKGLDKDGKYGIALYFDKGVLTLAKNSGDISFYTAGIRLLMNIPEADVKLMSDVAYANFTELGSGTKYPFISVKIGGTWERLLSDKFKFLLTGKVEYLKSLKSQKDNPSAFTTLAGFGVQYEPTTTVQLNGNLLFPGNFKNPHLAFGADLKPPTSTPVTLSFVFVTPLHRPVPTVTANFRIYIP